MSTLNATQLHDLDLGFERASAVVLQYYLKYQGLSVGAVVKEKLVERIRGYIHDRALEGSDVLIMLRELQENRNKRVYLYSISRRELPGLATEFERAVSNLASARIRRGTEAGEIAYSYVDASTVRICFVEQQQDVVVDVPARHVTTIPVTNVILLQVDRSNGWVTLSYDPPSRIMRHGSQEAYYRSYLQRSEHLLGVTFRALGLARAMESLQSSPLVKPRHLVVDTNDGSVQITGDGVDCREMGVAPGVERFVTGRERGLYDWLPADKARVQFGRFGVYSGEIPLLRSVPTDLQCDPGMVRFSRDCLSNEVGYVLSQIRAVA
ncbi:MAG TPA: hypothetical protein VES88_11450 [Gemmatimonadaceae bacterium]|nr:hypothetical protein [Gemmatimonadaceae bacterium]